MLVCAAAADGHKLPAMEQDPDRQRSWLAITTEPAAMGEGLGLDRLVTAVAFLATLALILLAPLAG